MTLNFLGNNVDGIVQKLESLENLIANESTSAIFFQETKVGRSGRIKTPSSTQYTWYKINRTKNAEKVEKGGGVAIGVLNILEPSWVSEGDDNAEAIAIEIWVEGFPIRLICAYGPQEYDDKTRKVKFWEYLNREVQNVQTEGAGIIIQMDGNLWAGDRINPWDPKPKMFEEFLLKNNTISVVNASPLCQEKFTRIRNMKNRTQQKTCNDYFLVCDQIEPLVSKMLIDEGNEIALTRYRGKVVQTDHKMLKLEVNLSFHKHGHH